MGRRFDARRPDSATCGFASPYTVTFGVAPVAIQNLTVTGGGTVTFASSGGTRTLNLTAAAGAQELDLGTNTTLILGTSGNIVNVVAGTNIVAQAGSDLELAVWQPFDSSRFRREWLGRFDHRQWCWQLAHSVRNGRTSGGRLQWRWLDHFAKQHVVGGDQRIIRDCRRGRRKWLIGSFQSGAGTLNVAGSNSATFTTGTGGMGIRSTGP